MTVPFRLSLHLIGAQTGDIHQRTQSITKCLGRAIKWKQGTPKKPITIAIGRLYLAGRRKSEHKPRADKRWNRPDRIQLGFSLFFFLFLFFLFINLRYLVFVFKEWPHPKRKASWFNKNPRLCVTYFLGGPTKRTRAQHEIVCCFQHKPAAPQSKSIIHCLSIQKRQVDKHNRSVISMLTDKWKGGSITSWFHSHHRRQVNEELRYRVFPSTIFPPLWCLSKGSGSKKKAKDVKSREEEEDGGGGGKCIYLRIRRWRREKKKVAAREITTRLRGQHTRS